MGLFEKLFGKKINGNMKDTHGQKQNADEAAKATQESEEQEPENPNFTIEFRQHFYEPIPDLEKFLEILRSGELTERVIKSLNDLADSMD